MKSIKRGRGPSQLGGVMSIFAALFGIVWMIAAANISGIFALFGLFFVGMAIASAVYNFRNASGENRMSLYDIVDSEEEPDPLAPQSEQTQRNSRQAFAFCPYCGEKLSETFSYCPKCGKKMPQ